MKKMIYVCSPYRGDVKKNTKNAESYCRQIMLDHPDYIPVAPHIYFTRFFDDDIKEEREIGMRAGLELLSMCDELWVCGTNQLTEGMEREVQFAKEHGKPIFYAF